MISDRLVRKQQPPPVRHVLQSPESPLTDITTHICSQSLTRSDDALTQESATEIEQPTVARGTDQEAPKDETPETKRQDSEAPIDVTVPPRPLNKVTDEKLVDRCGCVGLSTAQHNIYVKSLITFLTHL